jgi:hypothetical protein
MDGSVTDQRTRSSPIRPARPGAGVDRNVSDGRPSVELLTRATAGAQQEEGASVDKARRRKSARYSTGHGNGNGSGSNATTQRKGSIRNVVRRLFGRKSKVDVPPRIDSPHHAYHKSVSREALDHHGATALTPRQDPGPSKRPQTISTHPSSAIHTRIISAPLSAPLAGPLSAPFLLQHPPFPNADLLTRVSPNAVTFPKSAGLKPLNLGNPFYTRPHGPKRRATLHSVAMTEHEAAKVASTIHQGNDTRASVDEARPTSTEEQKPIGVAVTSDGRAELDRRRSRSANDLQQAMPVTAPSRDRTHEIEYWRRSYASVLMSPTGKVPIYEYSPPADPESVSLDASDLPELLDVPEQFAVEPKLATHPATTRSDAVSLPSARAQSTLATHPSLRSFSRPLATQSPEARPDLEGRIAKLEAHIVDFQRSLSNLALSNPSALAPTEPPDSSHRHQTPSIIVESLNVPQKAYQEDAGDIMEREWGPPSQSSTHGDKPTRVSSSLRATASSSGTFGALYNMLSEERSARRTLETQVRNLQHEVTRLQLSRGSWGSYSAQALPEAQRPRTPAESDGSRSASRQEAYNALNSPAIVVPPTTSFLRAFDRPDARMMSRFSVDSGEYSEYGSRHQSGRKSIPRSSMRPTPQSHERVIAAPPPPPPPTPYQTYGIANIEQKRGAYRFREDEMF